MLADRLNNRVADRKLCWMGSQNIEVNEKSAAGQPQKMLASHLWVAICQKGCQQDFRMGLL